MPSSYIDAISNFYPARKIRAEGNGFDYEHLIADDGLPLPPKSELDTKRLVVGQERKWREIQAERERRKYNGVRIGSNWFHTDDASRIQQIGLVLMGAALPPIQWKTLGGAFVTMTPTLAQQIFQSVAAQDVALFAVAEQHKAAMLQLSNPSSYDFTSGWPPTFVPETTPLV